MRAENKRLLNGSGCYVDDVHLPGVMHAAFLRSPVAHARVASLDAEEAANMPGVVTVVTAQTDGVPARLPVMRDHPGLRYPMGPSVLARSIVRYVGEPVAMVIAESRYVAEDALELVSADYEPMPVVATAAVAESGRDLVHESMPDNQAGCFTEQAGDPDTALATAAHPISFRCAIARGSAQSLEPRGIVAAPGSGGLHVRIGTQRPRGIRLLLAEYLGLDVESLRLTVPDTGGSFGSKAYLYSEELLVSWAALHYQLPVRWTEDRSESFLATYPEHEQAFDVEVGAADDGTIVGLRVRLLYDLGAYSPYGLAISQNTADHILGPYRIPNVQFTCRAVYTNKIPCAPYRGAGRPQGIFVIEQAMDAVAGELGLDPADVRRRNLIDSRDMPYDTGLDTPAGRLVYDSGDYRRCLDLALSECDYHAWRAAQPELRAAGRLIGLGVANYIECSITQPHEQARVELMPDGSFQVSVGVTTQGQGHQTVFAQIAADAIGVSADLVTVVGGDESIEETVGTYASRTTIMTGNAVLGASRGLRGYLATAAAAAIGADRGSVSPGRSGMVSSEAPTRLLTWPDVYATAIRLGHPVSSEHTFESGAWHVANGTHVAVIEVDPVSGQVSFLRYVIAHDAGRIVNHDLVEGQVVGGVAQGVAGVLLERLIYDQEGQLLTGNFMDYLLPTSAEVPEVEIHHLQTPSPHNPLGVKGAGEGGILPVYALVISAVSDALGQPLHHSPLTPAMISDVYADRSSRSRVPERAGQP